MRSAHPEAPRVSEPIDRTFQTVLSPGIVDELLPPSTPDDTVSYTSELKAVRSINYPAPLNNDSPPNETMWETTDDRLSAMNLTAGGTLVPGRPQTPTHREAQRMADALRLPSFELLGIAAPHPDRVGYADYSGGQDVTLSTCVPPGLGLSHAGARRALQTPFGHEVDILTPPADKNDIVWSKDAIVAALLPMDSPNSNPDQAPVYVESTDRDSGQQTDAAARLSRVDGLPFATLSLETEAPVGNGTFRNPEWLRPAVENLLKSLHDASGTRSDTLRVLSQALPGPSQNGHIFRKIIDEIHEDPAEQQIIWLNVLHAIHGEYNLQRLPPSSPLSTPGPAIGGDYFTTKKVFDTAVAILDYQSELLVQQIAPNRAVSSPASIDIAIVERYIPPTNDNEFSKMFDPEGPSILVDRLVELSMDNGSLVFIYPNKAGARTFFQAYLEPVKAPTLRAFAIQYSVPLDIWREMDKADAKILDKIPEHSELSKGMHGLCDALTRRSSTMRNFRNKQASFAVAYEQTAQITIDSDAWLTDWWSKQEKSKLRSIMQVLALRAAGQTSDPHQKRLPAESQLAEQLVRNMENKAKMVEAPEAGIEVSIFVITRTG